MTPEELLKEVGEPTCRVSTTGIITNQTNAPLEPGLELYTADQLIAARKGLEEEIERLKDEQFKRLEREAEKRMKLREQLATAEQIAKETAEACAKACEDVIGNTPHDQRMLAAIDCAVMLRSGAWKEFKK